MCGIAGLHRLGGVLADDHAVVRRMMAALDHRGPDGEGFWAGADAVLGHRRLAIIDLEGGHQPQFNETGEIAVVFNGEVYNFRDLRRRLAAAGHVFRTVSDTEVIVHGYEEWGDEVVTQLWGMFAFALSDTRRRRLLLVRDRLGVKPLYHADVGGGALVFASEIKALLAHPRVSRELNQPRLGEYLVFRALAGEETLFAGIRQLSPGTVMVLDEHGRRERRYWSPVVPHREPVATRLLAEEGEALLDEAVDLRLVSDVPLGTITSGGIDSSLVTAMAARRCSAALDTFCAGLEDPQLDERPYARLVAQQLGARHHEVLFTPAHLERELDRLTWAHDEPLGHPNSIPMHLVFREAKERAHVTVLLSGEGADEVFGGYGWYTGAQRRDLLARVPGLPLAARLAPAIGRLVTLRRVMRPDYLLSANALADGAAARSLVDGSDPLRERRGFWPAGETSVDGLFIYDQQTYLPPLLQRQDRMSMAAGVEARVPFLDHRLVEWANAIDARQKLAGGVRKALLREIAARWLPAAIIERRKVGFELPLSAWMRRRGPLAARIDALRGGGAFVSRATRPSVVDRLAREHLAGEADHSPLLWALVALESWASVFLGPSMRGEQLPGARTRRGTRPSDVDGSERTDGGTLHPTSTSAVPAPGQPRWYA
jgi:asparagine synthase (glutamine-hydrolysing)